MLPALPDSITEEAANQYIFGRGDDSLCGDNRKAKTDNKFTDYADSKRKEQLTNHEEENFKSISMDNKRSSTK